MVHFFRNGKLLENPTVTTLCNVDCVVIGGGIAGASIAAWLAPGMDLVVIEAEAHAGYHATGRSAALYSALYGNATIRALTRASRAFFDAPPQGFAAHPLLRPRDCLFLIGPGQQSLGDAFRADPDVRDETRQLDAEATLARVPILARDQVAGSLLDAGSADIDVDGLHQGFLRAAQAAGARLLLDKTVLGLARDGDHWRVHTRGGSFRTPLVVNAAGAWADAVGHLAGIAPVPLQPMRRTAALVDVPGGLDASGWPAIITIDESHYFKPDAGLLLISPADETPSPPCDAQPEELDVAIAVDRFETLTGQAVRRVRHRWAGLRVFSPDRSPVVGFDPTAPGFFWCAGQGGYGIQTAPALGRAAASLAMGRPLPDDLVALGLRAEDLAPRRFAAALAGAA